MSLAPDEVQESIDEPDRWCAHCGYCLAGLPEAGQCPECGKAYHGGQLILFGWGAGKNENVQNAPPRRLIWIIVASSVWMVIQGVINLDSPMVAALAFGVALVPVAYGLYLRYSALDQAAAPMQLLLFTEGYAVRFGYRDVQLQPWDEVQRIAISKSKRGRFTVGIYVFKQTKAAAEIACEGDDAAARRVRQRIDRWHRFTHSRDAHCVA